MPAVLPKSRQPKEKKPQRRGEGRTKPTPKQAKAIQLLTENILGQATKSVEDILIEAGYDPVSARQQTNVMVGIKAHMDPVIARLERMREAAMDRAEASIAGASYADTVRAIHTFTHNIRLLSGKSTSNVGVILDDRRKQIDELIES